MSDEGSPGRSESSTWSRLMGRLTKSSAELQADELHDASLRLGATPISALVPRQRVTVSGEVRSRWRCGLRCEVPALVAEVFDGTGTLILVHWLGRRAVAGIVPGVMLRIHGRVTDLRAGPTIYNPAYEISPPPSLAPLKRVGRPPRVLRHRRGVIAVPARGSPSGVGGRPVESAVPTLVFVVAWNIRCRGPRGRVVGDRLGGAHRRGQLAQGQTLRYVGWSVAAVVVAGLVATRTGRAQDAFLPGMLSSARSPCCCSS